MFGTVAHAFCSIWLFAAGSMLKVVNRPTSSAQAVYSIVPYQTRHAGAVSGVFFAFKTTVFWRRAHPVGDERVAHTPRSGIRGSQHLTCPCVLWRLLLSPRSSNLKQTQVGHYGGVSSLLANARGGHRVTGRLLRILLYVRVLAPTHCPLVLCVVSSSHPCGHLSTFSRCCFVHLSAQGRYCT